MAGKHFENVESFITYLNGYGRIQKLLTFIVACLYFPNGMMATIMFFTGADSKWICKANSTNCYLTAVQSSSNDFRCKPSISRTDWEFVESKSYSIITDYDLVCERKWLKYASTSIMFIGWMIGAAYSGSFANYYGRKLTMFASYFFMITIGTIMSFSPNIYIYIIFQFLIGLTMPGTSEVTYIYLGEMVDNKSRPFAQMVLVCTYTMSLCVLSLKAYFIRKWRYLRIVCSAPYLIMLIFYLFIPNTVHWLHLRGFNMELKDVFRRIAVTNKRILPSVIAIKSIGSIGQKKTSQSFTSILLHSNMRKTILILMFTFFIAVAVYFGFFMTADQFDTSIYLTFAFFSVVEFPSNIVGSIVSARFGRKVAIPGSLLIGSFGSFIVAALRFTNLKILRTVVGMLVQGSLIVSLNYLISWAVEILPTDIRAVSLGFVCSIGRLGGILVPLISKALVYIHPIAPFIVVGMLGIISGGTMFLLPETKGVPMDAADESSNKGLFHKYIIFLYDEHSSDISKLDLIDNTLLSSSTLEKGGIEP